MENKDLKFIQDQIGYRFQNEDLLQQAFVRRSYSAENGGENNEVLEFIGDKVLDLVVIKLLTMKYGVFKGDYENYDPNRDFNEFTCKKSEAELTELKKKLVQKKTLANRIDLLDFNNFLIMGNCDKQNNISEEDSVKEDLFEAILGAVALDSNWNLEELQGVVEIMLDPDSYLAKNEEDNYVELIQEWTFKRYGMVPWYHFAKATQSEWYFPFEGISDPYPSRYINSTTHESYFLCHLKLGETKTIFKSYGRSKSDARKAVCKLAYNYLEQNNLLLSIRDEIENPNKADAISQLEILARRGYFSIPTYIFNEEHDSDGNSIWNCKCKIAEEQKTTFATSSSKKLRKKMLHLKC